MRDIILSLLPIFGLILLGAIIYRQRILPSNAGFCLNQFVYIIALPALLFINMSKLGIDGFPLLPSLAYVIVTITIFFITHCAFLFLKSKHKEATLAGLLTSFPNAGFMGLPIIMLLFPNSPEASLGGILLVIFSSFPLIYADIVLNILSNEDKTLSIKNKIITTLTHNPIMIATLLGLIAGLCEIPIPSPIIRIGETLAPTASPCALFAMGMSLASQLETMASNTSLNKSIGQKTGSIYHLDRQILMSVFRMLFFPFLVFCLLYLFNVRGLLLASMTISSAMPPAVTVGILAEKYFCMQEDITLSLILNTFLSPLSLFLVISILHWIGIF